METETYHAFGESYTITRYVGVRAYVVRHDGSGASLGAHGTRGYATHAARLHAQRLGD